MREGQNSRENDLLITSGHAGQPPGKVLGTAIFWVATGLLLGSFLLPWWVGIFVALVAVEPIIYATHEALHVEANRDEDPDLYAPRVIAVLGMAFQLQNIEILRLAHLFHHRMGRYGDGWAPDITLARPSVKERIRYYAGLTLVPAVAWQVACIVRPFLSLALQPYLIKIGYKDRVNGRYLLAMSLSVLFPAYCIATAGIVQFSVFWLGMSVLWCLQQNIAHYSLRGVDPVTDRVCAHTYYLPRPFSWITYGSTSHFLHHADVSLRATKLYSEYELNRTESRLGVTVIPKYGIWPYLSDIFKQFRGPVPVSDLTLVWAAEIRRPESNWTAEYGYRRGRVYGQNHDRTV